MEFPENILATSKEVKGLMADFLDIQKNISAVKKNETNLHFKSKYANYAAVWETCAPLLNDKGILVIHSPSQDGEFVIMDTIFLKVATDEWLRIRSTAKPVDLKPQTIGLVHTYLKRYNVGHGLNLVFEDDDGNAGSGITTSRPEIIVEPKSKPKATRGVDTIKQIDPVASGDTAETLAGELALIQNRAALDAWYKKNEAIINGLPESLKVGVRTEYGKKLDQFKIVEAKSKAA